MTSRDELLRRITDHVETLTTNLTITEHYTWSPRKEGLRHHNPDTHHWVEHEGPLPAKQQRRINRQDPALIHQLDDHTNDPYATAGSHEPVTGSKPGSRPPIDIDTYDTLERLTHAAATWRAQLAHEAGKEPPPPAPVDANLAALQGLALHAAVTTTTITRIERGLKAFINESLIRLSYAAPMVTLGYVCGECGGHLRARADATTDPRCVGGIQIEGPAAQGEPWPVTSTSCGTSYPRALWADLLTQTG